MAMTTEELQAARAKKKQARQARIAAVPVQTPAPKAQSKQSAPTQQQSTPATQSKTQSELESELDDMAALVETQENTITSQQETIAVLENRILELEALQQLSTPELESEPEPAPEPAPEPDTRPYEEQVRDTVSGVEEMLRNLRKPAQLAPPLELADLQAEAAAILGPMPDDLKARVAWHKEVVTLQVAHRIGTHHQLP